MKTLLGVLAAILYIPWDNDRVHRGLEGLPPEPKGRSFGKPVHLYLYIYSKEITLRLAKILLVIPPRLVPLVLSSERR